MPVIGVTRTSTLNDYESALGRTGADARILDPLDAPETIVRSLDGLVLTGGRDIDPARFGEAPHETTAPAESGRDEYEIALVRAALEAHLPILAICRGIQVMNVAFGGSLVQDIPSMVPGAVMHRIEHPRSAIAHDVWIDGSSLLARLLEERLEGGDSCAVNSRHHQALKSVAPGFVVTATAPDGVIEAIERPDLPFCLGVQWHPENFWRTGEFDHLFESFVQAAADRMSGRLAP
jgi:putative glutamine amidotransferase